MTVTVVQLGVRLGLVVGLELAEVFAEFIPGGFATGEVWEDGRVVGVGRDGLGRAGESVCHTGRAFTIVFICRDCESRRGDSNP